MIKTILIGIYLIIPVILFSILVFPYWLVTWLKLGRWADPYVKMLGAAYSRHLLWLGGAKVAVTGLENIPKDRRDICFISNHQSYVDIPFIVGYIPRLTGFGQRPSCTRSPSFGSLKALDAETGEGKRKIRDRHDHAGSKSIRDGHPL
jgi:1-acyl-sn-glycerol-3-phosphate acyltransferase